MKTRPAFAGQVKTLPQVRKNQLVSIAAAFAIAVQFDADEVIAI